MSAKFVGFVQSAAETTTELPLAPIGYGLIALLILISLLGLTWTFRGSANKHR